MKKISLLDEALIAYLEALQAPNAFIDTPAAKQAAKRALIRWDNALFSAGVYRLAAQGGAAIWAKSATITEDQWTAFGLASLLTQLPSYNADVFLKLSQAKTFEDRRAIRIEAGDGVHSLTSLKEYHLHVAKAYWKKVNEEEETRAREAARELDKKAKLATIKLAETMPAMLAGTAAPAAKQDKRSKERREWPAPAQREIARRWCAARNDLGKAPRRIDFLAANREWLRSIGVNGEDELNRILDAARNNKYMPRWNKRKSNGKRRQV